MARIPVDQMTRTIKVRGVRFPIDCIRAAMLETGGKVVSDPNINNALDIAAIEHRAKTGKEPEQLIIEAIPATVFIPKKITLHRFRGDPGEKTRACLYFAVEKRFTFHA
jgi:hypothetical protein